jgi:hypothetical protein
MGVTGAVCTVFACTPSFTYRWFTQVLFLHRNNFDHWNVFQSIFHQCLRHLRVQQPKLLTVVWQNDWYCLDHKHQGSHRQYLIPNTASTEPFKPPAPAGDASDRTWTTYNARIQVWDIRLKAWKKKDSDYLEQNGKVKGIFALGLEISI